MRDHLFDNLSDIDVRRNKRQHYQRMDDSSSDSDSNNNSSIMNIGPRNQQDDHSNIGGVTRAPQKVEDSGSLMFWFKRSDFYVTGMDFVLSRNATMCLLTGLPFYIAEVCNFKSDDPEKTPYQVALAPAVLFISSFLFSLLL